MRNGYTHEVLKRFEAAAVIMLKLLLVLAVALAIVVLYVLFVDGVRTNVTSIDRVSGLQSSLQQVFAGVLLVLLGLELLETLSAYSAEHRVRIEVVLIVAMIALGRHIVQMDFGHLSGPVLLGIAGLMTALAASYFLIKSAHRQSEAPDAEDVR
jgi:uncharacterized membrane protein (DUF373 family)